MDSSYRAALVLEKAGIRNLYEQDKQAAFQAAMRLNGYILGRMAGLQRVKCHKEFDEAYDAALQFLLITMGLELSEGPGN